MPRPKKVVIDPIWIKKIYDLIPDGKSDVRILKKSSDPMVSAPNISSMELVADSVAGKNTARRAVSVELDEGARSERAELVAGRVA